MRWVASPGAGRAGVQHRPRVLLAVFAHPDDETFVGPVLARYARKGVKVYLAIATKGEKGISNHAGIPAGDQLAAVRRAEARCACQQLRIEPPIFFELNDGELGAVTSVLGQNVQAVAEKTEKLIAKLKPQVVVTWGPEGGYGHPDHRLVSGAVTQVIQAGGTRTKLYYPGCTAEQAKPLNRVWSSSIPWHTTDPSHLTVGVSFTKRDQDANHRAIACYRSQFTEKGIAMLQKALDEVWGGHVSFRPSHGAQKSQDLFR